MKAKPTSPPNIERATIAGRLLKTREDLGLSQEDLAKTAGISRSAIVRYEQGKVVPGGLKLGRLAAALGKSPNELLSGADSYFPSRRPEHALAGRDFQATSTRITLCLMALDRGIQERVSALLMAMVEAKKTKAEFAEFLKAIDEVEATLSKIRPNVDSLTDHAVREATGRKRKK
ncbi:MAG TPA: helix-turn-helix transcriptional regulator [Casimicrobiaceae bacterium]|jgi:transcriptional regulator with XRE-family HTH domain